MESDQNKLLAGREFYDAEFARADFTKLLTDDVEKTELVPVDKESQLTINFSQSVMSLNKIDSAINGFLEYLNTDSSFARVYSYLDRLNNAIREGTFKEKSMFVQEDFCARYVTGMHRAELVGQKSRDGPIFNYVTSYLNKVLSADKSLDVGDRVRVIAWNHSCHLDNRIWKPEYFKERSQEFPIGTLGTIIGTDSGDSLQQFKVKSGDKERGFVPPELQYVPITFFEERLFRDKVVELEKLVLGKNGR